MALLCVLVIALAKLSLRVVERPFRDRAFIGRKPVAIACAAGSVLFVAIGIAGIVSDGFERGYLMTLDQRQAKVWLASIDKANDNGCKFPTSEINAEIETRFNRCAGQYGRALVILGDSHGIDMYQAISLNLPYPFIVGLVQGGCRPATPDPDCHLDSFRSFIKSHDKQISKVLYNQAGFNLLKVDETGSYIIDQSRIKLTLDYIDSIANTVSLVWLGPSVEPDHNVKLVRKLAMSCTTADVTTNIALDDALKRLDHQLGVLVSSTSRISYFSVIDALNFDRQVNIYDCDAIYWTDGDHWSLAGEKRFGDRIVKKMNEERVVAAPSQ